MESVMAENDDPIVNAAAEAAAIEPMPLPEIGAEPQPTPEEKLRAELDEANDRYLRMLAETENYKKRVQRERSEERQYSSQETVLAFLPVADNLDRALQAALKHGEAGQLVKGVELTIRQFEDTLRKLGVEPLAVEVGKPFDPNAHQALFQEEHAEFDEGSVIEVLQKGYKLGERVIRPAMVKVSKKP
jgi:molecular chaperone GrpE